MNFCGSEISTILGETELDETSSMTNVDPEERRRALTAYMKRRSLTRKGWAKAAGLSSVNVVTNFLNGHSHSISTENLNKLARHTGDPIEVLLGDKPDPLARRNKTVNSTDEVVGSLSGQFTEAEVQNLQLILQELRSIRKEQQRLTDALVEFLDVLKSGQSVERVTDDRSSDTDSSKTPRERRTRRQS